VGDSRTMKPVLCTLAIRSFRFQCVY